MGDSTRVKIENDYSVSLEKYYLDNFEKGISFFPKEVVDLYHSYEVNIMRKAIPVEDKVNILEVPVNAYLDVSEEHCFALPENYCLPKYGSLNESIKETLIALSCQRKIYIHGPSGCGKDAFIQAYSFLTSTPAKIFQISPETDVQSWLYSLRLNEKGSYIREGELLKALRDGYLTPKGRQIPYLILFSDFDRASSDQAEFLRLILDSIEGRVLGIEGEVYKVLPGTIIVATANTSGSGDHKGRFISANPLDNSLLDRFDRFFEYNWLDWKDELRILKIKYPKTFHNIEWLESVLKKSISKMREYIQNDSVSLEFGHRALCRWLGHCEDIYTLFPDTEDTPNQIFKRGLNCYLDSMPDRRLRGIVENILDPHSPGGIKSEGDTSHIGPRLKLRY